MFLPTVYDCWWVPFVNEWHVVMPHPFWWAPTIYVVKP